MKFFPAKLDGLYELGFERVTDSRGWFVRVYDASAFSERGLCSDYAEHSIVSNAARGTIRGMHWQHESYAECKVIRCTRGAVYDVVVDVREESASFGRWAAFELRSDVPMGLYVPTGFAHGYQTLEPDSELHYLISTAYRCEAMRGIAFDSADLAIPWPLPVAVVSERDRLLPPFVSSRSKAPESP